MRPRQAARLLAGVVVFLACITLLDSPFRLGATQRLQMLGFAPQAWGFFASPRDAGTEVYRLRNGAWERADTPLGSAANLFGLRKTIVSNGPEFRTLESQVKARWSTAHLTKEQLPISTVEPVEVSNLARDPQLCGEVLLVERPPLPWAWAHARGRAALPTRYARLTVRC
jgi:sporulation delaying protein A